MNDDAKKLALSMVEEYRDDAASQKNFNALVYGRVGTGKTTLISTARKPILLHSFDPFGTKTKALQPLIESGDILVKRFETDKDIRNPKLADLYEAEIHKLIKADFFSHIGTYALDSLTWWYTAIMDKVMRSSPNYRQKDGWIPTMNAYGAIQPVIRDMIQRILDQPCDVIMTAHPAVDKDEITGERETGLLLPGAMADKIPTMFMEKWICRTLKTNQKERAHHVLQVHSDGTYNAETRIGGDTLNIFEEPNIKAILKKLGLNSEDKPKLT